MSKNSEYKCSTDFVTLLEARPLSLSALKLVHGCYFYIDQHPDWTLYEMNGGGQKRTCRVRCTEIMNAVGPRGAKDNRMIRAGIADLQGSDLFDVIELDSSARKLRFLFSRRVVQRAHLAKSAAFAMIDTELIAAMRSTSQIHFYTRAIMTERMRYPFFYLPHINTKDGSWSLTKRTWLRAAATVGSILGQEYLMIPQLGKFSDEVERVKVKSSSDATEWSGGKFYPRYAPVPVSIVWQGQSKTLSSNELRKRREWRTVSK